MHTGGVLSFLSSYYYLLPFLRYDDYIPNTNYPVTPVLYELKIINYFNADRHVDEKFVGMSEEASSSVKDYFVGTLKIEIQCNENGVKFIILDADEERLFISSDHISLKDNHGQTVVITGSSFIRKTNQYKIDLHSSLVKNQRYHLEIKDFTKILKEENKGYSLYSLNRGKETGKISATCTREIYMSRVIPCFNKPDIKAAFQITIGHKSHYTAVSNMPLRDTTSMSEKDGWVWSEFQKTPPIPEYLVAFAVGELGLVSVKYLSTDDASKELNIYSKQDKSHLTLAVSYGVASLKYFEKYFMKAYTYTKLDFVGIPAYYVTVLEHPGTLFFADNYLLGNESSSFYTKESVATSIFSGVAHQWFGIGVTFNTFEDGFWVREAVCIYLAIEAVDEENPDWNFKNITFMSNQDSAIDEDSYYSALPIIKKDGDLDKLYDNITFSKGTALIRMLALIFQKDFKTAIQRFVKRSSCNADDFFNELNSFNGLKIYGQVSVKDLVDSYIYKPGIPVVKLERKDNSVTLTQKRYVRLVETQEGMNFFGASDSLNTETSSVNQGRGTSTITPPSQIVASSSPADKSDQSKTTTDSNWIIPVDLHLISTTDNDKKYTLLRGSETSISNIPADVAVLLNDDVKGYFLPMYDVPSLTQLKAAIISDYQKLPLTNVYQFIRSFLNFAYDGCEGYDYQSVFELFNFMKNKDDYLLWEPISSGMTVILDSLKFSNIMVPVQTYFAKIIEPTYDQFVKQDLTQILPNYEKEKLRLLMIALAGNTRLRKFEEASSTLFQSWKDALNTAKPIEIPKNIRGKIFCSALRNSTAPVNDFKVLWEYYTNTRKGTADDTDLLTSLSCVTNEKQLERFLEKSLRENLEANDRVDIFLSVVNGYSDSNHRFAIGKTFFEVNLANIQLVLKKTDSMENLRWYVIGLLNNIPLEEDLKTLQSIAETIKTDLEKKEEINRAYKAARNKFLWLKTNFATIKTIITSPNNPSP